MVDVVPQGFFRNGFDLVDAGRVVSTLRGSVWGEGGEIVAGGERFGFRREGRRRFRLDGGAGTVAVAERRSLWSGQWTVLLGVQEYGLVKAGWFARAYRLVDGDREVGRVDRAGTFRRGAVAELPGLPAPVQAFVVAVVLALWKRHDDAASGGAAASTATTS